jgi:uncharacterized protein
VFFWLVRVIYGGVTVLLPAVLVARALLDWRQDRRGAARLLMLAMLCVATRVYASHIEPRRLQIRRVEYDAPTLTGAPIRIAHLSDIQSDAISDWETRVIDEVERLDPDLVVHTGDLLHPIDPATVETELPKIAATLARLAPRPMIAVAGDTDPWMAGVPPGEQVAGMDLLVDRETRLVVRSQEVAVLGLSLASSAGGARDLIERWRRRQPPSTLTIVLGHRPDFALELAGLDIDIVLAGHTHGGQIRVPWLGPIITLSRVPRAWARGARLVHGTTLLNVSAGIGSEHAAGLPAIRVWCPPEFTLLTVR